MKICVKIKDEDIETYILVDAVSIPDDSFQIIDHQRYKESLEALDEWEFIPGDIVKCEKRKLTCGGEPRAVLVAVKKVDKIELDRLKND